MKTFLEYLGVRPQRNTPHTDDQAVRKTLEFSHDEMRVVINITLTKHEQHAEAIQFIRRVADDLAAVEKAANKRAYIQETERRR
jgi:hypothetical protein